VSAQRRTWILASCFVLALAATLLGVLRSVERIGQERPKLALDAIGALREGLAAFPAEEGRATAPAQVAMLGDSMLLANHGDGAVPVHVERLANRGGGRERRVEVRSLALAGSGMFDYYFALDEVVAAKPDLVILAFNLTTLSDTWRVAFARPELASLVAPHRILEALTLPVYWANVTGDRLFGYVALMKLGALESWTSLALSQARTSGVREHLIQWADESLGASAEQRFRGLRFLRLARSPRTRRFDADREQQRFGAALAGISPAHPVTEALESTIEGFHRAGIPVYVYVSPANIDNLEEVGVLDREGLARTLASIEHVTRAAGASYSDFHHLLPNAAFSDPAGHFTHRGPVNGTATLARAIAGEVVAIVR
jgi:hypothetical protein